MSGIGGTCFGWFVQPRATDPLFEAAKTPQVLDRRSSVAGSTKRAPERLVDPRRWREQIVVEGSRKLRQEEQSRQAEREHGEQSCKNFQH